VKLAPNNLEKKEIEKVRSRTWVRYSCECWSSPELCYLFFNSKGL